MRGTTGTVAGPDVVRERKASPLGCLLGSALVDDPLLVWLIPQEDSRSAILPVFFTWLGVEVFLNDGRVDCLTADGTPEGELVAAALWADRCGSSWRVGSGAEAAQGLRGLVGEPGRIDVWREAVSGVRPVGYHEHLMFAGVAAGARGVGLGSRLLRRTHEDLDADGMAAYAEAPGERARVQLAAQGYRDSGTPVVLPDGGPVLFPMWRPAEAARVTPSWACRSQVPGPVPGGGGGA